MKNKIISIFFCILMFIGAIPISACAPETDNRSDDIVILFENDVHCGSKLLSFRLRKWYGDV